MSPAFLLNTNILSDLIRHPRGTVAAQIAAAGEDTVCTSIVVAAELRFGAAQSGSAELVSRVDRILSALEILPLEVPADRRYGEIHARLTRRGALMGPNDLLIAAHALSLGLTVVTANAGKFSRVSGPHRIDGGSAHRCSPDRA
jgi:tRNA(fMet)-specific endonuclease VapC